MTDDFINFRNIVFFYGKEEPVFDNLNLKIKRGQKVGLVGHSGAGKSTLINLLLKNVAISNYKYWDRPSFEDKKEQLGGDILINEQSIYDVTSDSLRSCIALIPQDTLIFNRTIKENISYSKQNATQEEIESAAKVANIHDFILSLPEKYNTVAGERGSNFSGGQRQRIAIARAIFKNAPILILDEATSALDSKTENEIQTSLSKLLETNNSTVIAIAHRLSTIKHMDRIIVMENGKIVEDGNFSALMQKEDGKFKQLWNHQSNGMIL